MQGLFDVVSVTELSEPVVKQVTGELDVSPSSLIGAVQRQHWSCDKSVIPRVIMFLRFSWVIIGGSMS